MSTDFDAAEFDDSNPEPRCPCVLLLDTSGSMDGTRIAALNEGLAAFRDDLDRDELARLRVEVAIVTFGGRVDLVQDFVTADQFQPPTLGTAGDTPMGGGINLSLDLIEQRKKTCRANGVPYFRPWVFLITDGEPTDGELWKEAARRVQAAEDGKKVAFFAVGVGGASLQVLAQISPRQPLALNGLAFREMFQWLSTSMRTVSHAEVDAEVPLQTPIGWAKA
jgi:uncharacterized protein YegL